MALSDRACRAAKGREADYKLSDGGGLYLLVKPSGTRLWNQAYRFSGKQKKLSHGRFPDVSLLEARQRRDEAKKLLASGIDPAANKKAAKLTAVISATNTFGGIAEEYLQRIADEGAATSTVAKNRWLLVDLAGPHLGARPIADITPAEILALLQQIERSGRRETARRLRSVIGTVFRLAVTTLRAKDDPTLLLRGALKAPKVQHRAAITDEKKFDALLAAVDTYDGWPTLRCALKFTALTFARPGEVRGATWAEIDMKEAIWRIDGTRTKVRRTHDVPCRNRRSRSCAKSRRSQAGAHWYSPLFAPMCAPCRRTR
jgi:integrase